MAQANNTQDARQLLFDFDVNPLRDPDSARQRRQVIRLGRLTKPTAEQLAQTLAQNPASAPTIIRPNAAEAHLTFDDLETRGVIVGLWRRHHEKQTGRGSVAVDRPDTWSDIVTDPHALRVICKMGGTDTGFYALLPPPAQAAPSLSDGFQVTSASVYFFPEFRNDTLKNKTGDEGRVKVWLQNIKDFTGSRKKASRRSSTATDEEPPAKRRATPASVSARATPIVSNAMAPATTTQQTMPAFARFRLANPPFDTNYMARYAASQNPSAVFPSVNQQSMTPQNAALHHLAPMGAANFHHHPQPNNGAQLPLLLSQPIHSTPSIAPRLLSNAPCPIDTNTRPHTLPDLRSSDQSPTDIYDTYQAHIAILDRQTGERRDMIEMLERHQAMDRRLIADLERTAARFRNNALSNSWHLVDREYSAAMAAAYPLPNGADSRRREVVQATRDVIDTRDARATRDVRDVREEHEAMNGVSSSSRGEGTQEGTEEGESEAS
ncbi:hypothetical protein KVT40_005323 [Elsinoe batatas]|uniref:Uncharacterized protein n=1 Tax=Elsinoe batatas TaxID=2601811 RepID=A0A8K0L600_9PEZI|nr:hypothetical protein KVT40_005323 [Elsinoe batatas]